jgi:hypothetical protein
MYMNPREDRRTLVFCCRGTKIWQQFDRSYRHTDSNHTHCRQAFFPPSPQSQSFFHINNIHKNTTEKGKNKSQWWKLIESEGITKKEYQRQKRGAYGEVSLPVQTKKATLA